MITDQDSLCITQNFSELFPLKNEEFRKISEIHLNSGKHFISTFDKSHHYLTTISVKVVSHLSEFVKLQLDTPSGPVLLLYSTEVLFCIIFSL